jgi:DedD protein
VNIYSPVYAADTMKTTEQTAQGPRARLILAGGLGTVLGFTLASLLLVGAYLTLGGGGGPPAYRSIPRKVETRARPTKTKKEGYLARQSAKETESLVIPAKPSQETPERPAHKEETKSGVAEAAEIPTKPEKKTVEHEAERPIQSETTKPGLPDPPSEKKDKQPEIQTERRGPWAINLASLASKSDAQRFQNMLKEGGCNAYIAEYKQEDKRWYRVRVGFFHSIGDARTAAQDISERHHLQGYWIAKQPAD